MKAVAMAGGFGTHPHPAPAHPPEPLGERISNWRKDRA
jgi:hypothetical protein